MLWLVNTFLMVVVCLLLAERLVGIKVIIERTVYQGEPNIRVLNVNVVQTPARVLA